MMRGLKILTSMMKKFNIAAPDGAIREALQHKLDALAKAKGALGRLEELARRIGTVQQSLQPTLQHPSIVVFAGDHGIVEESVSGCDGGSATQQVNDIVQGRAAVSVLARAHAIRLRVVDAGLKTPSTVTDETVLQAKSVRRATRNFMDSAAITPDEWEQALAAGAATAEACRAEACNVLGVGCVGAGSTSAAAVWLHLMAQVPLEGCVGAGYGLGSAGVRRKVHVLREAVDSCRGEQSVEEVMRRFGGYEMVMAVGAVLQAASQGMIVLFDGFVMGCVVLAAARVEPSVLDYCIYCSDDGDPSNDLLIHKLGMQPLLSLGIRQGAATGTATAYPLIESAVQLFDEMGTR